MTLRIVFLILIMNCAHAAQKHLYIMGAGGEEKGETTTFDGDIEAIGKFSSNNNWQATVTMNGGHSKTEQIIAASFSGALKLGAFNQTNYEKMLADIESKITEKKIKKGEQLLIMIDSHGAMAKAGEASHSISLSNWAASDKDNLQGSDTVSLDKLKKIIDLASASGIKLAVIDDSCHSGNSLHIANPDTCIISTTGDKHYGYGSVDKNHLTFGGKFYKNMQKGKNLEDIYINSRTGDDPDFPMISTQNGRDIQKMLYELMTPYLYYDEVSSQKFIQQYFDDGQLRNMNQVICSKDQQYNQLMSVLNFLEKNKSLTNHLEMFNQLQDKIHEYRGFQKEYERSVGKMRAVYDDVRAKLKKSYPKEEIMSDYDIDNFLATKYDFLIEKKDLFHISKERVVDLEKKKKIQADIMQSLKPELKETISQRQTYIKSFFHKKDYSRDLAAQISSQSKKLYKLLYESNMDKNKSNPCKDFVL